MSEYAELRIARRVTCGGPGLLGAPVGGRVLTAYEGSQTCVRMSWPASPAQTKVGRGFFSLIRKPSNLVFHKRSQDSGSVGTADPLGSWGQTQTCPTARPSSLPSASTSQRLTAWRDPPNFPGAA